MAGHQSSTARPNFFDALGLKVSATEPEIRAQIDKMQGSWSRQTRAPGEAGAMAQRCLDLLPEIRKVMLDAGRREQEAVDYRELEQERTRVEYAGLDDVLEVLTAEGLVRETEFQELQQMFPRIDQDQIRKRIGVPVQAETESAKPAPPRPMLEVATWRSIVQKLAMVEKTSLYDFLGVDPQEPDLGVLQKKANELYAHFKNMTVSQIVTSQLELAGSCLHLFGKPAEREKYDVTARTMKLRDVLDPALSVLRKSGPARTGPITPVSAIRIEALLAKGIRAGFPKEEVQEVLSRRVLELGLVVERPAPPVGERVRCRCGMMNPASQAVCSFCGYSLTEPCLGCRTPRPSGVEECPHCGLTSGNIRTARELVRQAAEAGAGETPSFRVAWRLARNAQSEWPSVPGADEILQTARQSLRPRNLDADPVPAGIQLEWTGPPESGRGFRVHRLDRAPGAAPETLSGHGYDVIDLRWLDAAPGEKPRWYAVESLFEGFSSLPIVCGPVVAVAEVAHLDGEAGDQHVELTWQAPSGPVALRVFRGTGGIPRTTSDGKLVASLRPAKPGEKQTWLDREVTAGQVYGYRVVSVFKGTRGNEVVSEGASAGPFEPFRVPAEPARFRAQVSSGSLVCSWVDAEGSTPILVRRRDRLDVPPSRLMTLERLTAGAEVLHGTRRGELTTLAKPWTADMPWHYFATPFDSRRAVIHRCLFTSALVPTGEARGANVHLSWPWPHGLRQARVERLVTDHASGREISPRTWSVARGEAEGAGHLVDSDPELSEAHARCYSVLAVSGADEFEVLSCGVPEVTVGIHPPGTVARLECSVLEGRNKLEFTLDRAVREFPPVEVVVYKRGKEEGQVVLTWPGPKPAADGVRPFQRLQVPLDVVRANTPQYVKLRFKGNGNPPQIVLVPLKSNRL